MRRCSCALGLVLAITGAGSFGHAAPSGDPMPAELKPPAAKPDPKPTEAAKPPATEVVKPPELSTLTDDPLLGKGSRVNGEETQGVVAFTFDDGPNPETTPAVIDALQKYDVPATFFIVTQRLLGKHGAKSRDLLARELAGGFLVGSHSVSHPNLKNAAGDTIRKEIDQSFRTLSHEANRPIGLFRPPYGALSGAGRARLKKLGVTEVIWSIDTLDWRAHNADKLRKKVLSMIVKQNGGVVLMHDVKPITAKIIDSVLDDLEGENCQRLADQKDPIVPVSLHYFLHDGKTPRAVPADIVKRTDAYKLALPTRCAARPIKAMPTPPPRTAKPDAKSDPAKPVGDFPTKREHVPKTAPDMLPKECFDNPLAKGCN